MTEHAPLVDMADEEAQQLLEEDWPEPQPIRASLLPVADLVLDIIPKPYKEWIADVSHRMQVPVEYVAVAAIVMTSSLIGAGCGIKPKRRDDWLVVPNLYGGIVGPPGVLKTPAVEEAMRPLSRIVADARAEYEEAIHESPIHAHPAP